MPDKTNNKQYDAVKDFSLGKKTDKAVGDFLRAGKKTDKVKPLKPKK